MYAYGEYRCGRDPDSEGSLFELDLLSGTYIHSSFTLVVTSIFVCRSLAIG